MKLLIKQGHVIDPVNKLDTQCDLCIAEGKILAVGAVPANFVADRTLDASGMLVLPGLVDLCARGVSTVTTTEAALAGGITSIVQPPDSPTMPIDARNPAMHLYHLGALTVDLAGHALAEMATDTQSGCVGFSQGDVPVQDTAVLLRAMQYARTFDKTVWCRPQDPWLSRLGIVASGAYASRLGLAGRPVEAETIACQTLLALQRATGVRMHLSRLSSAEAVGMVRAAKKEGLPITCDTTANHLHLTDVDIGFYDSRFRLEPPLRGQRDRDALRLGLLDGTIDAICSDHTTLTLADKQLPFVYATPGSIGTELLLSLVLKWAHESRIPLINAFERVTSGPGQVLAFSTAGALHPGSLTVGVSADVCVVNPNVYWQVSQANLISSSEQTPFLNRELPGRVQVAICRGQIAWERKA